MAVTDWNTNPDLNTAIDGINIAEGCPAGNMNGMGRAIMASVRLAFQGMPNTDTLVPRSGAVFTGAGPRYEGRGGLLHNADPSAIGGRVIALPEGTALPGMSNGDIVLFY